MPRPDPDDDRETADASFLFRDEEEAPAEDRREAPSEPSPSEGGYDLIDDERGEPSGAPEETPQPPVPPPVERARPRPRKLEPEPEAELTPSPVDPPWTRMGEWKPTLIRLAVVATIMLVLIYLIGTSAGLLLPMAIAAAGVLALVLLSYPIAITLERPVRMTPEQALRDYYGALSHHIPHYRRMWLLLSSAGRSAPEFGSYDGFRSYWKRWQAELREGESGSMAPLTFKVVDFESDKSAGQEAVKGSYTISVSSRGRESEGPLHTARMTSTFSRGPDRMWYLDDGTLPPA